MGNILIMAPTEVTGVTASRGSDVANLLRPDPKEIWLDSDTGVATIDLDLGQPVIIDTVFLGSVFNAVTETNWTITGGMNGYADAAIKPAGALRIPDQAHRLASVTHAFWAGGQAYVRYLRITLTQPDTASPLAIGVVMIGQRFQPSFNQEWGAGRGVKDTGTVTRLPSGGVSIIEGARYGTYKWTLGDLTDDEAEYLYELQLDRGETRRILVVENPDRTPGLRNRIHYGLLTSLKPFERRNPAQTTWDFQIEDWAMPTGTIVNTLATTFLTLGGETLSLGGAIITFGANA